MKEVIRFLGLYKPYWLQVTVGIVLSLITVLSGIALLAISGWFIAAMGLAGAASLSINYFTPAAMIRGLSILRITGRYGERYVNHDTALKVTSEFRSWFLRKLEPIVPGGVEHLYKADIFARLRGDIDALERFYLYGIVPIATALAAMLILGVGLYLYHPPLSMLVSVCLIGMGFGFPLWFIGVSMRYEKQLSEARADISIRLTHLMQGIGDLLVNNGWHFKVDELKEHERHMSILRSAIHSREAVMQSMIVLLSGVCMIGGLYLVIPHVHDSGSHMAEIALIALLLLAAFDIISPLPAALQSLSSARHAAMRIFELADREGACLACADMGSSSAINQPFVLDVRSVCFSYDEKPIISDVSFFLKSGDVLVVVGESGAGKSTLLEILMGLREPEKGSILINNKVCTASAQRAFFSCSPQAPFLFSDTVRSNITLGAQGISMTAIEQACQQVFLYEEIMKMPEGFETYVGENGTCLSGGQIKRFSHARALLYPAACLLLDEPGEGLNKDLEQAVMESILREARKKEQAVIIFLHGEDQIWIPPQAKIIHI